MTTRSTPPNVASSTIAAAAGPYGARASTSSPLARSRRVANARSASASPIAAISATATPVPTEEPAWAAWISSSLAPVRSASDAAYGSARSDSVDPSSGTRILFIEASFALPPS